MNKDIQVLRFFAISFVILLHTTFIVPDEFRHVYEKYERIFHSNTGVELFFVIAGYFMMSSLSKIDDYLPAKEKLKSTFDLTIKKLKRLTPSVYVWATIPLVISIITNNHVLWLEPSVMIQKFLSTVTYMTNFEISGKKSYFEYFWAISLEVQFFIIFPFIFAFLGKKKTLALAVAISFIMTFYRPGGEFFWWFRFDGMLMGVLLYYFVHNLIGIDKVETLLATNNKNKVIISFLMLCALASTYNTLALFPNFKSSAASIISCILVLLAVSRNNYFIWLPSCINKIIISIGNRSYSLFCSHVPSWLIVRQVYESFHIQNGHLFTMQIVMMFVFCEFSYRFIEKGRKPSPEVKA